MQSHKQVNLPITTIAIVGPGAIGGSIAAWLSTHPNFDVQLCSRRPLAGLQLKHPEGVIEANVAVVTQSEKLKPVDWIVVATKTYDAEGAAKWFLPLTHSSTRLAVLQNGVEHVERFAPFFDEKRIVPVVIDLPAERLQPDQIHQRGPGLLTVPDNENGKAFASLFSHTPLTLNITDDFLTAAWNKLCINAAGVVSALTLKPAGVIHDDHIAETTTRIVKECADVGRALGAKLPEGIEDQVINNYRKAPKDSVNSLHGDRLAGKMGEVDARQGVIVRMGKRYGIPTPCNQMAFALLNLPLE